MSLPINPNEQLLKEMSATRKALALTLKRLAVVEEKLDWFTTEKEQQSEEEKIRRRERCWT